MILSRLFACFAVALLAACGCCSDPAGRCQGWSVSIISINVQLGGTRTDPSITTRNDLGQNSTQMHTLPVESNPTAGATSASLTSP